MDLVGGEELLLLREIAQEGVDPRLKELWAMSAGLNDDLSAKNLVLAAELTQNHVAKLLFASELVEEWRVDQRDEDLESGRFIIVEFSELEVAHDS